MDEGGTRLGGLVRRFAPPLAALVLLATLVLATGRVAEERAARDLCERASAALPLATASLAAVIEKQRLIPTVLARDPSPWGGGASCRSSMLPDCRPPTARHPRSGALSRGPRSRRDAWSERRLGLRWENRVPVDRLALRPDVPREHQAPPAQVRVSCLSARLTLRAKGRFCRRLQCRTDIGSPIAHQYVSSRPGAFLM